MKRDALMKMQQLQKGSLSTLFGFPSGNIGQTASEHPLDMPR